MRDLGRSPTDGPEAGAAPAPGADGAGTLGTGAHVRRTLDRVSHLLADARSRQTRADALRSRTESALASSQRSLRESEQLQAALRSSVSAYARHLHDAQVPPQRMLVMVKDAVREATPVDLDVIERRALMENVVRWSIEAYYAA